MLIDLIEDNLEAAKLRRKRENTRIPYKYLMN